MKFLNVLCASLAICLQVSTASAQTPIAMQPSQGSGITLNELALVCSLLPQDLARACFDGLAYNGSNSAQLEESNRMLIQICNGMPFADDRTACRSRINAGFYSSEAIKVCSGLSFGDEKLNCVDTIVNQNYQTSALKVCSSLSFGDEKVSCLKQIGNQYFDTRAMTLCLGMSFGAEKMTCMKSIANKDYQNYEIDTCRRELFAEDKSRCLNDVGRFLDYREAQGYNNGYVDYGTDSNQNLGSTCRITNGEGTPLTNAAVPVDQFLDAVSGYAESIGRCVTAEIKGIDKSSAVFNQRGGEMGSGLSQKKAADVARALRQRSGESSCARVECR